MKEEFEVIEIKNGTMTLKSNRPGGCHSCKSPGGCGAGIITNYVDTPTSFQKPIRDDVSVGDFVTLEISSSALFSYAFMFYMFPILLLFVGSYIGMTIYPENEPSQIIFGFTGFLSAILFNRYIH